MRMKNNNTLCKLMVLGFFFLIGIILTTQVEAKTVTIIFSTHDPKGGSWAELYEPFFTEIEKRTNGEVKIEQHWNGELVGLMEAYDAVADGVVDLTHYLPMMMPNKFPMEDYINFNSNNLFVYGRGQLTWELFNSMPEIQAPYDKTKVLFEMVTFPNFYAAREGMPIKSYEDCKGKKYITVGKWDSLKVKAYGMVPMTVMPPETFMSLQTGVIDGCVMTFPAIYDFQLVPVVPNISLVNTRGAIFSCIINRATWDKIPEQHQKTIQEIADKMPAKNDAIQLREYRELQKKFPKDNPKGKIYEFSQEELAKFKNADAPVEAQFISELNAKGLPGDKLMKTFHELEKKYASKEYEKYEY